MPLTPDQQIDATLAAVYRDRAFTPVEHATPLSALLARDEESDLLCAGQSEVTVWEAKQEGFRHMMAFIFAKGPDPRVAMRRLYALAKEVTPEVVLDLSHEEIALLLGDDAGRATSSARSQAMFGGIKSAIGQQTQFGHAHKSTSARQKMSAAQMGNQNRRGGKPKLTVIEGGKTTQPKAA